MRIPTLILLCLLFSFAAICNAAEPEDAATPVLKQGRDAMNARRYTDAVSAFKKANKIRDNRCYECYMGMAGAYLRMGDLKNAVESADKAAGVAASDAERAQAHNMKGGAYLRITPGDPKKAEAEYREALRLDPHASILHLNLAMALFKQSQDEAGKEELRAYLAGKPDEKDASFAEQLLENPRRARERYAPDFALTTMDGQELSLKQLAGKIVVIDFWATWCPACVASIGDMKELVKKYNGRVVVVSVSADRDETAWREFVQKKKMDWPQYLDDKGSVCRLFDVHAFPSYMLIDGEGIIRKVIVGSNPQESLVVKLKDELKILSQNQVK